MDAGTDSDGGRWMSYAELATLRGIDKQSAVKLTFRRRWRRQKDNHGTVQVLVPPDWLESQRPSHDPSDDAPMDPSALASMDLSLVIKPLEDTITTLREENARLITMIDGFSARADRAEQALVAERSRADTLHDRLDATQDDLRQAREAADQAKHHAREAEDAIKSLRQADEERKARGRWARLRAAWRGQ